MKQVYLILAALMLLCLAPMPYGYYMLVRFVAMVVFGVMAYQYGSDADPRDPNNHGLRNDCQDIAKRYWSRANISDFEEASPIYRIEYVNP